MTRQSTQRTRKSGDTLECAAGQGAVAFFKFVPAHVILDKLKGEMLHPDLYDPLLNRGYVELAHHLAG